MDRNLLDYLPPVLREVLEFQAINGANEPEIALAWDALARVLANQFLAEADAQGVAVWERAQWNLEKPYTLPWLRDWITGLCGPAGHTEAVTDYTLRIELDYSLLRDANRIGQESLSLLCSVRPANLRVLLDALMQSQGAVSYGGACETSREIEVFPAEEE